MAEDPLTAILENNIFPVVIPQTAKLVNSAALTYKFISSNHSTNIRKAAGMQSVRVRFRVSGFSRIDVEMTKEILRNLFQGFSTKLAGLPIVFVTFENEVDDYSEPLPGSDLGTHWKEFDFLFKLRETIPTNT